jgi:hypothetical protein
MSRITLETKNRHFWRFFYGGFKPLDNLPNIKNPPWLLP